MQALVEAMIRRIVAGNAAARAEANQLTALAIESIRNNSTELDDAIRERFRNPTGEVLPEKGSDSELGGRDGGPIT